MGSVIDLNKVKSQKEKDKQRREAYGVVVPEKIARVIKKMIEALNEFDGEDK